MLSQSLWPTVLELLLLTATIRCARIRPKVFIISMFTLESNVWHNIPEFNLLERNITVPGFSMSHFLCMPVRDFFNPMRN